MSLKAYFCFVTTSLVLLLGFAITFSHPQSALAFIGSKGEKSIHARFDLIESKIETVVQTLQNLHETSLRNQAEIKAEMIALRDEFITINALTEESNRQISQGLEGLKALLEEKLQKIGELNQAFFEQDKKSEEVFQENVRLELENITSKIADLAAIYKASAQENIERDNNNTLNLNQKMEEIDAQVTQLIEVYKNMAIEENARGESLVLSFNKQLKEVNKKISQLIEIYKQSISTVTTSNKSNLVGLNKQLVSINSKIKLLTEIYKTSIKENDAAITTMSINLSKELQSIKNKLSKRKPSATKK